MPLPSGAGGSQITESVALALLGPALEVRLQEASDLAVPLLGNVGSQHVALHRGGRAWGGRVGGCAAVHKDTIQAGPTCHKAKPSLAHTRRHQRPAR